MTAVSRLVVVVFFLTTSSSNVLAFSSRPWLATNTRTPLRRSSRLAMVATGENEFVAKCKENESFDWPAVEERIESPLEVVVLQEQQRKELSSWNMLENPSVEMGRLLVIVAAAIYGTNFAAVKMLDQVMPLGASAALRFSLAAIVVTGVVLGQEKTPFKGKEKWMATLLGAEVGMWYCFGYLCQAHGLHTVDASKSAFFNALAVIFVPLLDSLFRRKTLGPRGIGSVVMAVAGVALLQIGPSLGGTLSLSFGDVFCLAQALFFGIGYWRLESTSVAYPNHAARITVGQLVAVAGGAILYCILCGDVPSLLHNWWMDKFIVQTLVWTGLISTALALYLETVALQVVTASELTVIMTSISLWGSAFAYISMGEVLAPIGMLGGLLILSGCVLTSKQEPK